ncbi:MAG: Stp1/IreP family PP2C-type Ser/Thr phosphatase [Acidimicrobiia bacterium]|nr:Stp1/IreP family PP2C-type Ser/Thr phosphatase [Acidimicrobiia bacterium]
MRFTWATRTDTGRVRDHNEDAVWPEEDGSADEPVIVAVADGMGGHAGGEVASSIALETATSVGGEPAMRVQAANVAVVDAADKRPRLSGMGTTLTLGLLDPDGDLDIAHVGDSRAYLFRGGELEQVTRDHSYVADMIDAGKLTREEAAHHPYRSVLTRAVGLDPTVEVDSYGVVLEAGDRILLCSDGVTDMIDDDRIASILADADAAADAADGLVEAANEAGGGDNITVVVVDAAE